MSPRSGPHIAGLRMLLVEDDVLLADALARTLRRRGADATVAPTLGRLRDLLDLGQRWDVVLLDQRLPDGDALDLLEELAAHADSPIIAASAILQESKRALHLQAYRAVLLPKPFGEADLLVAIGQALERVGRSVPPLARESGEYAAGLHYESISMNLISQTVLVDGTPVELQPTQFRILAHLIAHAGSALGVEELVRVSLRGTHSDGSPNIRFQIHALRRRLGSAGALIQTVAHGYGIGVATEPARGGASR